jgi:hypothetical protein
MTITPTATFFAIAVSFVVGRVVASDVVVYCSRRAGHALTKKLAKSTRPV